MNNLKRIFAIVFISLMLVSMVSGSITLGFASAVTPNSHVESSNIWTDKADYHPGENVTIYGTSFLPNTFIDLNVTKQNDGTNTLWKSITDANGNFETTYQIGAVGAPQYAVKATDGTNIATTTFTDSGILARVQGPSRGISTSSSISVSLSQAPTSGNVLIAVIGTYRTGSGTARTVDSITQTGVAWVSQANRNDASGNDVRDIEIWLGTVGSGASATVSITLSGAANGAVADICEYSGIVPTSPIDKTANAASSSATTSTSTGTTSTTVQGPELWIGGVTSQATAQSSPTNGFALLDGGAYNSMSLGFLEKIVSTTGAAGTGTTTSSNYYVGCIATFKSFINIYSTSTTLNAISSPLSAGQTGVAFSGTVTGTSMPAGLTVNLQVSSTGTDGWSNVASATTVSGGGFSGTFVAPTTTGTWYYRANFAEQGSGSNDFTASTSTVQSINVVYTGGGITRVQGPARQISTSSSFSVTLSQTPTVGDVLIAVIGTYRTSYGARTVSSISQTGVSWGSSSQIDNQYTSISSSSDVEIWLGTVISSGASTSVSITLSGSSSQGAVADICEYRGIAASSYLDRTATTTGTGTSTSTGATSATAQGSELWIGGITVEAAAAQSSPTNGFTMLDGATYSSMSLSYLEKIVSVTGAASSGTTVSSNRYDGCIATFKGVFGNFYSTTTSLSAISSPLSAGQTSVSFSGSVSSGTAVPNGEPVVLQYSPSSSGPWTAAATVNTVGGAGAFSGTFTAPAAGTYYFQAYFASATSGSNVWQTSTSSQQTIAVNNVYSTTSTLDAISTPLSAGQTSVSFSGSVSSGTAVPNGEPVVLQYSPSSSGPWTAAATVNTVGGAGAFSGTFTAPAAGTYYFQVYFAQATSGDNVWSSSTSTQQAIVVSNVLSVSVLPGSWAMDVGQSKQFSAVAVGGSGVYTGYQWYVDGVVEVGQIASTFTYSAVSVGSCSITVTVTDSLGATSPQSSAALLAVAAAPSVGIAPVGPFTMDAGQTQSFIATFNGGSGAISYQWYLDGVAVGSNSASYTYTASGTSASVTCKITDSASTPVTSPFSNAVLITLNSSPSVSVAPLGPLLLDIGQSQIFTAAATGGTGALSYQWFVDSVLQSETSSLFTYSAASAGSFLVTCKVTDSAPTPFTSPASNAVSVTVAALPTVTIAPTGPLLMDVGQSQMFTATTIGGSGILSYQWYLDGVAVGSNSAGYSYTASGTSASVTCVVTDSASIPVTSPVSNAVSVAVASSPTVSIAPVGPLTLNTGGSQTFTATASGGSGVIHYQWYLDSSPVGSDSSSYLFSQATGSYLVTCKVTDSASTPVTSAASNAVSVSVNLGVSASVSPSSWAMDVGQSKQFSAVAVGGSGVYTGYQWYVDGVVEVGQIASTFTYSAVSVGSCSITVTVTDSLGATSPQSSAALLVVAASPIVSITPVGPLTMDTGQTQVFTAIVSGGSGVIHYQWYVDAVAVGSDSSSYSYTASGTSASVTCKVTDSASTPVASPVSNAVSITVNAAQIVSVAPILVAMDVSQSQVFTCTASGGSGALSYQWYVAGLAVSGQTGATYSFTAGSSGSPTIYCIVTDSASTPFAVQSNIPTVTVASDLSVSVSPGSWPMDVGQSKMFTAVPVGGSGSYTSYQWYVDSVLQSETGLSFVYSGGSAGSHSITVTVTDSLGLTSVLSSAASVVVAASPTVSVGPLGPLIMDVGQSQMFTATTIGGSGILSYQWYLDGVAVGSNSAGYSYTASGTSASVTCVVTDSASIPVTSPASNVVLVTVSASPTVSITPVGSLTMDVGQSQLFTASAIGGSGTIHYEWYVNGIAFGTDSSSCTYTASGSSASVSCVVTDSASTPVASPVSNAVSITVNAAQIVSVAPILVAMDVSQSQVFTCTASGGSGALSYQWYVAGLAVSGQTGATYSFTAGSSGSPTIYCIVTDSASTPFAVQSNTPSITVNAAPTVSVSPGAWTMDVGQSKMFTAVPIGGSGSYTGYQWYVNGVAQSGKTTSTFTCSPGTGSYSITVTVTDSSGATSALSSAATLTMNAAMSTPSVSASSVVINQGQPSTLSITGLSGGSTPYTYQWFEKTPGTGSYVIIGGATSSTYPFSTSGSTALGVSSFEVQVTDSASSQVTVTSSAVKVIVNSGSTAWDFEDHTYTHIDMTTETPTQIATEMTQMNGLFAQYGLPAPIAIAYPQGYYNTAVESAISSYRLTARLASNGFSPTLYPISNYYEMSSRELASDTTLAQVQAFIDQAVQQKGQLNLYTHLVTNDLAVLQLYPGCTPQLLGQVLDYLQTQQAAGNLQVLTVRQAYGTFNGQIAVVTISFDDALGTDYSAAYPLFQAHGLAGTSYIVGSAVDNAGWDPARLTWAQIEEMAQTSPPAWTLNVNSSPSAGGSTSVSGTTSVHQFSLPVTATAAPGYVFGGWSFDGTMSLTNPITLGQGQQAGGSVHTLIAYFVPITSSTVFTDDFESGSFTNWWASTISSTIVTSPVHSGTYSARATGYTYWDHYLSSGQSDLFFSGYVQFPQLLASDQAVYLMYINDGSYTYTVAGGIYESSSGTSNQWLLGIEGNWFLSSSPANLQTNHWYFMEIEYNANGVGRMWVDGMLVSIGSGPAMSNAQDVQGGNPFGGTPSDFVSYGDDYSVSNQYIPVGYQITVTQSANGQISPATATYVQSSTVAETITPNSGYYIASITVDGTPIAVTSSSGQTVSFNNIQAVHTITATFTRNWQITVTQTANGLISPNSAIYTEGSNPSETITPNTGYYIASITVDEVAITVTSSNGQTVSFNNILASHTITATFAPITVTYQITVTQTANGLISPGIASCPAGSSQDEVITPNSGYYIASINVDGNPMTVSSILGQTVSFNNIAASHTVTATYAQITWQITVIQTSNGLISPDTASYAQGNSPTETITPNSNWYIASITVDGNPMSVTSSSGQTVIFNNIQAAHTITATFAQITWQITVTQSSNGLISPSTTFYSQGSSPGETVTPANGYYIASITVDDIPITVTSNSGQTVIFNNIQAAHTITATFAQIPVTYQIIVTQSANGLISPDTASYAQGSSATETITPNVGYHIASLTVNGQTVAVTNAAGQTYQFVAISTDSSISASFAIDNFAITVTQSTNGLISGPSSVDWGTDATFTFVPSANCHIVDVLIDGVSKGAVASYTITNVQATHTVTASFAINGVTGSDAYLVVRGADNTLYYRTFDSALGTWNSWIGLPGSTVDSPAAVVCGNELHIVVRGMDGITLWHGYVSLADGSFSGWTWISGTTPSPPTLASNGAVVTLVVRGADNNVYYRVYTVQTRTWGDWQAFAGELTCDKVSAVIQGNVLVVVARGYSDTVPIENNMLWQASVNLDSGAVSGGTWIPGSAPSSPTLVSWKNGNGYCLVVRGMDNSIYINVYTGSGWRGWTALPTGSTPESPTATVIGDKLYLIVVGMDGVTLWENSLDLNSNSFSGWSWISGTTPSKPVFIS